MLEFTQVFEEGYEISTKDIPNILKCKNIDFGHVLWPDAYYSDFYSDYQLISHIIDNIIGVNVRDNNCVTRTTLLGKICYGEIIKSILSYILNNGYLGNLSFEIVNNIFDIDNDIYTQSNKLSNYLTIVSFNRFKGYYNLEKYYYITHTMLLVMKAQHVLPRTIIKHLIIPFIYQ